MQKREYLFVYCDLNRVRYVNDIEPPKRVIFHDWANQRGDEGWELVSESYVHGDEHFLSFKRPKA